MYNINFRLLFHYYKKKYPITWLSFDRKSLTTQKKHRFRFYTIYTSLQCLQKLILNTTLLFGVLAYVNILNEKNWIL